MTAKPEMVAMKLERNYRPAGKFDIVGHTRPEIRKKDPSGREIIVQAEEWIEGEPMPGAIPGAGYGWGVEKDAKGNEVPRSPKLWAGTVISLAKDEALNVNRARIGVPHLA